MIEKLDGFKKAMPNSVPKDTKFSSCHGVLLSIFIYAVLIIFAYWLFQVIRKSGLPIDGWEDQLPEQDMCVP